MLTLQSALLLTKMTRNFSTQTWSEWFIQCLLKIQEFSLLYLVSLVKEEFNERVFEMISDRVMECYLCQDGLSLIDPPFTRPNRWSLYSHIMFIGTLSDKDMYSYMGTGGYQGVTPLKNLRKLIFYGFFSCLSPSGEKTVPMYACTPMLRTGPVDHL